MIDRPIRVFCVDDHEFLREGLRARIDLEPDMEIVGGQDPWFNGRFAWIMDLSGHKIELWEPAEGF